MAFDLFLVDKTIMVMWDFTPIAARGGMIRR